MSHILNPIIACPEIQDALDVYWRTCPANATPAPAEIALIRVLRSAENRNGLNQVMHPFANKKRQVDLIYHPRPLLSEAEDTPGDNDCAISTNEVGDLSKTYTIDDTKGTHYDFVVDLDNLADSCKDNMDWLLSLIAEHLAAIERKAEDQHWDQMVLLKGNFGLNETNVAAQIKTVQTLDAAGNLVRNAITQTHQASIRAGYCGEPIVFGFGAIWDAYLEYQAGCCGNENIDLGKFFEMAGATFIPSMVVEDATAVNDYMTMYLGAAQLINFNRYSVEPDGGMNHIADDAYKAIKVFTPNAGLPVDMIWQYKCRKISISLDYYGEVVGFPDDRFDIGDRFAGVTGINQYRVTNP